MDDSRLVKPDRRAFLRNAAVALPIAYAAQGQVLGADLQDRTPERGDDSGYPGVIVRQSGPAVYILTVVTSGLTRSPPVMVVVKSGAATHADITCDTGIR